MTELRKLEPKKVKLDLGKTLVFGAVLLFINAIFWMSSISIEKRPQEYLILFALPIVSILFVSKTYFDARKEQETSQKRNKKLIEELNMLIEVEPKFHPDNEDGKWHPAARGIVKQFNIEDPKVVKMLTVLKNNPNAMETFVQGFLPK